MAKKTIQLMGILNITPDSFSDGGLYQSPSLAMEHALKLEKEGAHILDVGAESTRPGAEEISPEEQLNRLKPVLVPLIPKLSIPVSLDTRHSQVAEKAIEWGVQIINDVSGFEFDPKMISIFSQHPHVKIILMHSRGTPKTMKDLTDYKDVVKEIVEFFLNKIMELESQCISRQRMILDPGIGFAKTTEQNLEILTNLFQFKRFGLPLLVGVSRKSFLETWFGPQHANERIVGTEVAHSLAVLKGADILRVHDVAQAKKTIGFLERSFALELPGDL